MGKYALDVKHNGTTYGDFCLYQTDERGKDDIRSLVWFKKSAHPNTQLHFEWEIDYGITWSETGNLVPGIFRASGDQEADLSDPKNNLVDFSKEMDAFHFSDMNISMNPNCSVAEEEPRAPCQLKSCGLETELLNGVESDLKMNGKTRDCSANSDHKYSFKPHPHYWIAFGNFEEGEILDLSKMTEVHEIDFQGGQSEKTIELTPENTFKEVD